MKYVANYPVRTIDKDGKKAVLKAGELVSNVSESDIKALLNCGAVEAVDETLIEAPVTIAVATPPKTKVKE